MNKLINCGSSKRTQSSTRLSTIKRGALYLSLGISVLATISACSSPERSRSLGDATVSGKTIAMQVCSNCHGAQGISTSPNFPNLAAQSEIYTKDQLKAFKSHGRSDPAGFEYMWGLSAHLTDEQINDLAAYYAAQKPPAGRSIDANLAKEGQSIFENGIASNNTPACSACHGTKGEGMQQFPRLAGQHGDYIVKQLIVFQRTDDRPEGPVMKTIAHGLTGKNIESVAAYLEAYPASK